MSQLKRILLVFLILLLAACQEEPAQDDDPVALPTQASAAALPTATLPPTSTPEGEAIPPTRDFATATPQPTFAFTPVPTSTPEPIDALVNITVPENNTQLLLGQSVSVAGLVRLDEAQTVTVALITISGRTLLEVEAAVADNNGWQTEFAVPQTASGEAQLQALVRDAAGEILARDAISVTLAVDTTIVSQYLIVSRPVPAFQAVGGYYLYFDGLTGRPANNRLNLQILTDNCQTPQATQGIVLNGSGYWQAFVYVPNNITGTACALASFGEEGAENRREVSIPIEIMPPSGPDSYGIMVASPPPGGSLFAGQTFTMYGTAYNARDSLVQINVTLADGQSIAQATAAADDFGYWETTVTIPFGIEGQTTVIAFIGAPDDDDYREVQQLIRDFARAYTDTKSVGCG